MELSCSYAKFRIVVFIVVSCRSRVWRGEWCMLVRGRCCFGSSMFAGSGGRISKFGKQMLTNVTDFSGEFGLH